MDKKYRVGVLTDDVYLFQKIKLGISSAAEVAQYAGDDDSFDLVIADIDGDYELPKGDSTVTLSRWQPCEIDIPFDVDTLLREISKIGNPKPLRLSAKGRLAFIDAREVRLTEVEFRILEILVEKNGEFVSREELLNKVWQDDAEPGVVNVYIHYLREKLESNSDKVILSSRKCGYRLSEKYVNASPEE